MRRNQFQLTKASAEMVENLPGEREKSVLPKMNVVSQALWHMPVFQLLGGWMLETVFTGA